MRWRRLGLIAAVVAAIVVIAVVVTLGSLDAIVKKAIEQHGSSMTQTAVRVESVRVSLRDGTAILHGFSVANPPGFAAPYVFELGEIGVQIDVGSMRADPIIIKEIRIEAPRVTAEVDAAGKSNVEKIRKAVEGVRRRSRSGSGNGGGAGGGSSSPADGPRLIIERLAMHDGEVYVDARAVGGPEQTEKLPGFELTGIGAEQGGATPPEVGRIIVTALARDVAVAVAATQIERYVGKEGSEWLKKGGAKAIQKGLGDVLDQVLGK